MSRIFGESHARKAPEQEQFAALLREHRRIVFKVVSVHARNPHDRDDLAQEIAVQLRHSFGSLDARCAGDASCVRSRRYFELPFWLLVESMNAAASSCSFFSDGMCAYTMWPDGKNA